MVALERGLLLFTTALDSTGHQWFDLGKGPTTQKTNDLAVRVLVVLHTGPRTIFPHLPSPILDQCEELPGLAPPETSETALAGRWPPHLMASVTVKLPPNPPPNVARRLGFTPSFSPVTGFRDDLLEVGHGSWIGAPKTWTKARKSSA